MGNPNEPAVVSLSLASFEEATLATPLPFEPPLAHLSDNPHAIRTDWTLLQYVFNFEDPATIVPFGHEVDATSLRVADRFVRASFKLASSPFLTRGWSVHYEFDRATRFSIATDYPHSENLTGFSTLLRQFHKARDESSFASALGVATTENAVTPADGRSSTLKRWLKAETKLRKRPIREWVGLKLIREGKLPGTPTSIPGAKLPGVSELIETFNYGDLIHWGDHRTRLEQLNVNELHFTEATLKLYEGMAGLATVYMGFAVVLDTLFDLGVIEQARGG